MNFLKAALFVLALTALVVKEVAAEIACEAERGAIREVLDNSESESSVLAALDSEYLKQQARGIGGAFCAQLRLSVESIKQSGLRVSAERFINHAVRFEGFRLESFISSGVAPKKYFGFFDEQGDTATYEKMMRQTVIDASAIIARHGSKLGLDISVSEKEIVVTFLAEGGALLLTNPEYSPDRVHPVRGIGLDDYQKGFKRFPDLIKEFDQHFGTVLDNLLLEVGDTKILIRPMTFREAILGTAVMYLYEKELATQMMHEQWKSELSSLPLESQFIFTSLVYNSGIAFAPERIDQIIRFDTGEYLDHVSKNSKRPRLLVKTPAESTALLASGEELPRQLTSWNAVYHILQRYGAWVALDSFSLLFDRGRFLNRNVDME